NTNDSRPIHLHREWSHTPMATDRMQIRTDMDEIHTAEETLTVADETPTVADETPTAVTEEAETATPVARTTITALHIQRRQLRQPHLVQLPPPPIIPLNTLSTMLISQAETLMRRMEAMLTMLLTISTMHNSKLNRSQG